MAKNSITDYSKTAASNTDIQSVDIAEGCLPSGINNAIREIMADLADMNDGTVTLTSPSFAAATITGNLTVDTNTLYVDSTNNRVGIGTSSPSTPLEISSSTPYLTLKYSGGSGTSSRATIIGENNDGTTWSVGGVTGSGHFGIVNAKNADMYFSTNNTERMRIDSSGNVGIGATTVDATLQVGALNTTGSNRGAVSIKTEASDATIGESAIYIEEQSGAEGYYIGVSSDGGMFFSNSGASTPTLFLGDDDKVGIGTSSPASRLHVQTASSGATAGGGGDELILENSATAGLSLLSGASNDGNILFGDSGNSAAGYVQYKHGNDALAFGTVATERMRIDSSGNVGIGTSSPNISGFNNALTIEASNDAGLELSRSGTAHAVYGANTNGATITGRGSTGIRIFTTTSGTATERMRIDSSGNVLVGTTDTSPYNNSAGTDADNGVVITDGRIWAARNGGSPIDINRTNSDGDIQVFRKDGTAVGSIGTYVGYFTFGQGDTGLLINAGSDVIHPWNISNNTGKDNIMDLGASSQRFKDLYLGGGIYLGGTGSANHLDDYEEGTWTATTDQGTLTSSDGKYVKVGNLVTATVLVTSFSNRTSTGNVVIRGLPFATGSTDIAIGVTLSRFINATGDQTVMYLGASRSYMLAYNMNQGSAYDQVRHADLNSSSANFHITISYRAA